MSTSGSLSLRHRRNLFSVKICRQNRVSVKICRQNRVSVKICRKNRFSVKICRKNRVSVKICRKNRVSVKFCTRKSCYSSVLLSIAYPAHLYSHSIILPIHLFTVLQKKRRGKDRKAKVDAFVWEEECNQSFAALAVLTGRFEL